MSALSSRFHMVILTPFVHFLEPTILHIILIPHTFKSIVICNTMKLAQLTSNSRARRTNGATQTFRRPSHATGQSGSTPGAPPSRDTSTSLNTSSNPGVYVPPHAQSGRNGNHTDSRYSKDQLIQLFRGQQENNDLKEGLSKLYVNPWDHNVPNGSLASSWARRDDQAGPGQAGAEICWDKDGTIVPLSLEDMTEEEKEVSILPLVWYGQY